MKKLKTIINKPYFSLKEIKTPIGIIQPKEVFQLVDIWYENTKEGKGIWIAIETDYGIVECGFTCKKKISTRQQLREALFTFLIPYIEGVEYVFINSKSF